MTVSLAETGRSGNNVTVSVNWSVTLGSETRNSSSRTLYIYRSTGAKLAESEIKTTLWDYGKTYSGSFTASFSVGTTQAGTWAVYIQTDEDGTQSCIWTNRSYCTNFNFSWSLYVTSVSAPTGLTISPTLFENSAVLAWTAGTAGTNNAITGYRVYYRQDSGTEQPLADTGTAVSRTLNTSGFERGAQLEFRVESIPQQSTGNKASTWSSKAFRNHAPNAPTNVGTTKSCYAPGEAIRVTLSGAGDPDGNLKGFEVAKAGSDATVGSNYSSTAAYVDVPTSSGTWTPGISYALRVRAVDTLGAGSDWVNVPAVMVGLPAFVYVNGEFKRAVSMQVYVPGEGFKPVKGMKLAAAQGPIDKTVF